MPKPPDSKYNKTPDDNTVIRNKSKKHEMKRDTLNLHIQEFFDNGGETDYIASTQSTEPKARMGDNMGVLA